MPLDPNLDGPASVLAARNQSSVLIPAQEAVDALIAAEGNMRLAAERLHVPQHTLVASIAADPTAQSSLNAQLKALTTLHTFDTLRLAKVIVQEMMSNMEPGEFARFYTNLVQQVATLTDSHETTSNINITEVVLKMLPPDARNALLSLVQSPPPVALNANPLDDDDVA